MPRTESLRRSSMIRARLFLRLFAVASQTSIIAGASLDASVLLQYQVERGESSLEERPPSEAYSSVHCIGPTSDDALASRSQHPDYKAAGFEDVQKPPWWRRSCHAQRVCTVPAVRTKENNIAIIAFLSDVSAGYELRGLPADAGSSPFPLAKLQTQKQYNESTNARRTVELWSKVGKVTDETTTVWHSGKYALYRPWYDTHPQNFGHVVFDDFFAIYSTQMLFGEPDPSLKLLTVDNWYDPKFLDWSHTISAGAVRIMELGSPISMHCFEDLYVGFGPGAVMGLHYDNVGRASAFRSFRDFAVRNAGVIASADNVKPKVLIMVKKAGRRLVTGLDRLHDKILESGLWDSEVVDDLAEKSMNEQMQSMESADVIVTPMGGISMTAFFARPGTSIVFIGHVQWEDTFWSNVQHLNPIYYIAHDSEVPNHEEVMKLNNANLVWDHSNVDVDVDRLFGVVKRGMATSQRRLPKPA